MDAEKEIYIARRFRRRAFTGVLVAMLGLAGLAGGLHFLYLPTPAPPIEADRIHPSCVHPECKVPHVGAKRSDLPENFGTGVLVLAYLVLCGGVFVTVVQE